MEIPAGEHLIRSVELKSGVELYLKAGARLLGSRETFDCDDVEGLDGESVAGEGVFAAKPI